MSEPITIPGFVRKPNGGLIAASIVRNIDCYYVDYSRDDRPNKWAVRIEKVGHIGNWGQESIEAEVELFDTQAEAEAARRAFEADLARALATIKTKEQAMKSIADLREEFGIGWVDLE